MHLRKTQTDAVLSNVYDTVRTEPLLHQEIAHGTVDANQEAPGKLFLSSRGFTYLFVYFSQT